VLSFVYFNAARARTAGRKRAALAAVHIAATFSIAAGVRAPAGVCPDWQGPSPECLSRMPKWLGNLAALNATEALMRLKEHAQSVKAELWKRVEAEYNAGVKAARFGLTMLEPGELGRSFVCLLLPTSAGQEVSAGNLRAPPSGIGAPKGRFYYIAAGVGCGIKEAEEVRAPACTLNTFKCSRRRYVLRGTMHAGTLSLRRGL
jgi:hypothetical protein